MLTSVGFHIASMATAKGRFCGVMGKAGQGSGRPRPKGKARCAKRAAIIKDQP